jgi:hypothetical protein
MGYNQNCLSQSCYSDNCCNQYGWCPSDYDPASYDYTYNSCYYYYETQSTTTSGTIGWIVGVIIVVVIIIGIVFYCIRKRAAQSAMQTYANNTL